MTCRQTQDHLDDYLRGTLDFEQTDVIKKHLEVCSECRGILERENALIDILKSVGTPDPGEIYWDRLDNSIFARTILDENTGEITDKPKSNNPVYVISRYLIPLAASILLLLGSLYYSNFKSDSVYLAAQSGDSAENFSGPDRQSDIESYLFVTIVSTTPGSLGKQLALLDNMRGPK